MNNYARVVSPSHLTCSTVILLSRVSTWNNGENRVAGKGQSIYATGTTLEYPICCVSCAASQHRKRITEWGCAFLLNSPSVGGGLMNEETKEMALWVWPLYQRNSWSWSHNLSYLLCVLGERVMGAALLSVSYGGGWSLLSLMIDTYTCDYWFVILITYCLIGKQRT